MGSKRQRRRALAGYHGAINAFEARELEARAYGWLVAAESRNLLGRSAASQSRKSFARLQIFCLFEVSVTVRGLFSKAIVTMILYPNFESKLGREGNVL